MNWYNKRDLGLLAKETAFLRDNLEKFVRLVDILELISNDELLSQKLALKGGTAINLLVFNMPRLSVDIDLDFTDNCDRDEMMQSRTVIGERILAFMATNGYALNPNTKKPHSLDSWVFGYVNTAGNHDVIKIEINYSMRVHVLPIVEYDVNIPFIKHIKVRSLAITELFGSKIKALIERNACRDLYDVNQMISSGMPLNYDLLRKIVLFYLAVGGNSKPQDNYSFSHIDDISFKHIRAKLLPVLRKNDTFVFEAAKKCVKNFLSELLVFNEEELCFIKEFNNKHFVPQLLFEDEEIVHRITSHPMALWKCQKT